MDIGRVAGGENPFIAGSADDMAAKIKILFSAGSYGGPVVKLVITVGYSARRGPAGNRPAVIHITTDYLKTVGEDPSGEYTFCSSGS